MSPDLPQHHGYILSTTRTIGDAVPAIDHYSLAGPNNAPFASGTPQPPGSNRKKQRLPKTKSDRQLTKSISTPHLRGPIMSESELDKKRNKLGYQRISIACAHCRRRKIRCLVAEDDPEQRCQNCIRLKKECVFYPVDQQAMLDARSEASNKSGAPSAPSSTVSTSPLQSDGRGFEQHAFSGGFGTPAMPPMSSAYQSMPIVPSPGMPVQGNYPPQDYAFQAPGQSAPPWPPADFASHSRRTPVSRTPSVQPPFSRYPPAPAPDVAPFPGHEQSAQSSPSVPQVPYGHGPAQMQQQQQPYGWQPQTQTGRAVSFPDYPQTYPAQYQQQQPQSSYPRQPPIQPPMQQSIHPPAPGMMPMPMPAPGQHQYMTHHDPRSMSAPGVPSSSHYPVQQPPFFGHAVPSQSPVNADPHRLPSNFPPNAYHNRPGGS